MSCRAHRRPSRIPCCNGCSRRVAIRGSHSSQSRSSRAGGGRGVVAAAGREESPARPAAVTPATVVTPTTAKPVGAVVHVVGAVRAPGVVELGSTRVVDAIRAAGGATDDADLQRLNLAALVTDGQRIAVPRVGEPDPAPALGDTSVNDGAPAGPIDVNTATEAQLETLPGIGPSLAAAIIAEREKGPFKSVDDLGACAASATRASNSCATSSPCRDERSVRRGAACCVGRGSSWASSWGSGRVGIRPALCCCAVPADSSWPGWSPATPGSRSRVARCVVARMRGDAAGAGRPGVAGAVRGWERGRGARTLVSAPGGGGGFQTEVDLRADGVDRVGARARRAGGRVAPARARSRRSGRAARSARASTRRLLRRAGEMAARGRTAGGRARRRLRGARRRARVRCQPHAGGDAARRRTATGRESRLARRLLARRYPSDPGCCRRRLPRGRTLASARGVRRERGVRPRVLRAAPAAVAVGCAERDCDCDRRAVRGNDAVRTVGVACVGRDGRDGVQRARGPARVRVSVSSRSRSSVCCSSTRSSCTRWDSSFRSRRPRASRSRRDRSRTACPVRVPFARCSRRRSPRRSASRRRCC